MPSARLGFIGTGLMGGPMATRLLGAGHAVTVWNRSPEKAQSLQRFGAMVATTAAECASGADIVFTMLEKGSVVGDVLFEQGVAAALQKDAIVVDMSSIAPAEAIAHATALADLGIRHLDAPVSGGTVGAANGTLSIMVGGDPETFEIVRPYLEAMGRPTRVGPGGSGQIAKLANQMIVATTIGAVAEALVFAAQAGADAALVRDALRGGFAESRILELHVARMVERSFVPGGRTSSQIKDLENAVAAATRHGLELPFAGTALGLFRELIATHGDVDHAGLWLTLADRAQANQGAGPH